jgi:bifunctional DNase/RNase
MDKKVELRVISIINTRAKLPAFALLLQEVDGDRRLPVIIGPVEAQAITVALNHIGPVRPLTHDLFASTLRVFGIDVMEVVIYEAVDGVFYSYIYYKRRGKTVHVDSRTSDAIALAVRASAPIYINASILEKECMPMDAMSEEEEAGAGYDQLSDMDIHTLRRNLDRAVGEENYELASILRDEIKRRL